MVIPALLSGNSVILKHSSQTPLAADRYDQAGKAAGLPEGVFQILKLPHQDTEAMIADKRIDGVFLRDLSRLVRLLNRL